MFQVEGGRSPETRPDRGKGCRAQSQTEAAGDHQNNISGTVVLIMILSAKYIFVYGCLDCLDVESDFNPISNLMSAYNLILELSFSIVLRVK